ncbi:MAG: magnesium/cobalt transporter CorA [Actinomycetota bacterium]|nr:magnesium/cobalt transporter CorA [Actinomycetota bacterium]
MIKTLIHRQGESLEVDASGLKGILTDNDAVGWVDLSSPTKEELGLLVDYFGFHPLAMEDAEAEFNLPKIDTYSDHLFIVWHSPLADQSSQEPSFSEVDIFVTSNLVVTIHYVEIKSLSKLYERAKESKNLMGKGPGFILHAVIDHMVDEYYLLIDKISDDIDLLEDEIFGAPSQDQLKRLFGYRRKLLAIRKIVAPQREVISLLIRHEKLIGQDVYLYFQDIYDHLVRILDFVDTSREVISGAMEIYLSQVSNKMNEVMKRLTIVATIFMPLTLITSLYGMNFRNMPELNWRYGYFIVLAFMTIFSVVTFIVFKRKRWW